MELPDLGDMTMQQIPLVATAAQSLNVVLSQQLVRLDLRQRATGLFMDVWCNGTRVLCGVACLDRNPVVRDACFGVPGDLMFVDQQGTSDPSWDGLGTRYLLLWDDGGTDDG
ncbi:phage baseplate plug family protein [Novacetimonas pomaceti]|uniref:Cyanophage baseplate Pam3 plug gp18 domain-containing protein n=1 Tax=Novacetimonas pomaceti TaxID=2021998 RepID=A0ABX5P1R3_9PROT|nr:hypothetical protein [Novacetimonas pomaceti]MBV1834637.1 hypothetical protein [Novacetimonas pomaceti]PYD47129.1 hypothetical protein C3920_11390 [Novacetimonas pomaceti]